MRLSVEAWGWAVNPARKDYALAGSYRPSCSGDQIVDTGCGPFYGPHSLAGGRILWAAPAFFPPKDGWIAMKIKNSLRALRNRHRNNRVVRRRGRLYVINKTNRRYKARQG